MIVIFCRKKSETKKVIILPPTEKITVKQQPVMMQQQPVMMQ